MKELTNIYKEAGQQFVDDLFKDYLLVTEKLSGSSFSFERHGDELRFFKGSNKQPINLVDRTLMMYYESAIQYILNKTEGHIKDLPEYWRFCFQYFVNNQPGAIEYDNLPTNNLVLTHIQVRNAKGKIAKVIEDPRVLRDWASAFNVTPLIPIFSGYLKEEQKRKIREFLSTPKEDQLEVFGTSSFAKYLIDSLNPTIKQTTLQNDLNKPIDSIIFKFFKQGTNQIFTAKMIDPYTEALMKEKEPIDLRRAPADINEILLLDILAFIEERGLRGGELLTATPHERYLELVSNLFNDYVAKRGVDLQKIDIEKAEFAKGPEFDLNLDLIKNNRTREILQKSESLQNLYKIILGSLRKKRNPNRVGAVMTASVIEDFNKLVSKIGDTINKETDGKFKTFGDYLNNKVTEEIDHKDLEELVVEEKVLNYNNFINLGKVIIEANVEDQKFKNQETGRMVKVSSALGYDKNSPAYKKAKEIIGDKEPTEKTEDFDISKIDKKNKSAFKLAKELDEIEDPKQKEKAVAFIKSLSEYESAEPGSPERKKALEKFLEEGNINRNALGEDTTPKFYVGQKDEYEGSGDNRSNKKTGLPYNSSFTKTETAKIIKDAEELGIIIPMQNGIPRTNGKRLAPTNIHTDSKGNKPKAVNIGVSKIEAKGKPGDKDYDPGGVKLGGENGIVMKNTPPMTEGQRDNLKEQFKKGKPEATEEEIKRYLDINETFRKQNNQKIKDIQEKELTIIPILDENDQEIDVFTKGGQKKAVKAISNNVTGKINKILDSPPKITPSPRMRKSLDDFNTAASDFAEGNISQEEFKNQMNDTLIEMKNDPHLRPGMPDLVETFAMMEDLSQGRASVSPDASNFALADIITFDPAELPVDATPEEINKHINLITTSSGSRSIKFEAGGASQSLNKVDGTEYADFNDKVSGAEVKSDLQGLANKQYENIYGVQEEPPFKTLEGVLTNGKTLAKKYDIDLDKLGLDPLSEKKKKTYEDRASKKMVSNVIKEYKEKGIDLSSDDAKDLLIGRWTAMDINGNIMEQVNNKQQMSQSYTNRSYNTDPSDSGTTNPDNPDILLGEDNKPIVILDSEGNPKLKGGKKQYRRKQKNVIKETNGVSDLACMNYSDNPGYSASGKPANKMPTRVYNCKGGNKWLG